MIKICLSATLFLVMLFAVSSAVACDHKVVIDSVEYGIHPRWCDKLIDSTYLAVPESLVLIPPQYCFEDSRIYVDRGARDAFVRMAEAAQSDSIDLIVDSGYRSARYQARIILARMAEGESFDDVIRYVAPPGYSEHETGRTVDIVPSDPSFARTDAYRWLVEHAAEFNYYETYPKDTTGQLPWESWHWTFKPDSAE